MALNTQTFTQLVSNTVAAIQGAAAKLLDLTVGSILRAFVDAQALLALWLQGLILAAAALTRFATSFKADADSWAADFNFFRLPSQPSTGQVTLSRFTPTNQASIQAAAETGLDRFGRPIWVGGSIVQTPDGTQQYQVIPDSTQSAYNAGLNVYLIPVGTASIPVTVQAVTAGAAGNASAGQISALGSAIAFVDTVTNALPFTNGADQESDPAFKARFVLYINNLASGTVGAIENAVVSLAQDVTCEIVENLDYSGAPKNDYFYAVVNDGTGSPSSQFLANAAIAIDAVRPVATAFAVFAVVPISANVTLDITVKSGYLLSVVEAIVKVAIQNYIAELVQGESLAWARIPQIAFDASAGVSGVAPGWTINGLQTDLACTVQQTLVPGTITVGP